MHPPMEILNPNSHHDTYVWSQSFLQCVPKTKDWFLAILQLKYTVLNLHTYDNKKDSLLVGVSQTIWLPISYVNVVMQTYQ